MDDAKFPRRIIIIDDTPEIFNDFKTILMGAVDHGELDSLSESLFGTVAVSRDHSYSLDYAGQGREGYEKIKEALELGNPYQLAFVDMRMPPGWDGLETIRNIRNVDSRIQVVICTAYSDRSWEDVLGGLGKSDSLLILKKPFDTVEVSQMAEALTEKWRLARQAELKLEELERLVELRTQELVEANRQRLKMEARISQAQKMESLNVMAGSIANNFNNLLSVVMGHLDMALLDIHPDHPCRYNIAQAEIAAQNAAQLNTSMLTYVGQWEGTIQTIQLTDLVKETRRLLHNYIPGKIKGDFHLADQLPLMPGFPDQIKQVVLNLVTNAVESVGSDEGKITISTGVRTCDRRCFENSYFDEGQAEGEYVYLEVVDTGCGMDEEIQAKLFDPYFTTKYTGRGMGMAVVQGIVRKHKGTVVIDTTPFKGTSVCVLFPALSHVPGSIPAVGENKAEFSFKDNGSLLLVDDEMMVQEMAKVMLTQLGFVVITADNGSDAVELFGKHKDSITCVMLDVSMPGMTGTEALMRIRKINPDIPAIIFSGYSWEQLESQLEELEPVLFLHKPFQYKELKMKIKDLLS